MLAQINYQKKGFTLIELLVALSIIAIISAVGFINYSTAQVSARDARRKQDLRSIQTALALYYQTNKAYPNVYANSYGWGTNMAANSFLSSAGGFWITNLSNSYINSMPVDPLKNEGNPAISEALYGYSYWTGSTTATGACPNGPNGGQYYVLVARLENSSDPDRNANKSYKHCDPSITLLNPVANYPNAYIVTSH